MTATPTFEALVNTEFVTENRPYLRAALEYTVCYLIESEKFVFILAANFGSMQDVE